MTVTTGMLMRGKMSVGMVTIDKMPGRRSTEPGRRTCRPAKREAYNPHGASYSLHCMSAPDFYAKDSRK